MAGEDQSQARRVLAATSFGHGMTHLYMLVFPALVTPLRAELGLSLGDALELAFLGYLLYGLGALPSGIIADRWSPRNMLALCVGLSGCGALLASVSQSPLQLVIALALIGLGASIYHPTGMAMISRAFHERRGRALGVNGVFGNVGLAAAPFVAGLLAALSGWRTAYQVLGVPGVLGALAILVWVKNDDGQGRDRAPEVTMISSAERRRFFLVLCVAMTLGGLSYRASSLVMPSYFELKASFLEPLASWALAGWGGRGIEATGVKTAAATTLTSLVYLVGIVGQMIGGRIADKHELRVSYVLFHLATLPALIGMARLAEIPLFVAAMAYVLFSLGMQPIENSLVAKLSPPEWRSTAYGLKFILTFGVGAFAVSIVGIVEQRAGLASVFALIAVAEVLLVAIGTGLWLLSRRVIPRVANA